MSASNLALVISPVNVVLAQPKVKVGEVLRLFASFVWRGSICKVVAVHSNCFTVEFYKSKDQVTYMNEHLTEFERVSCEFK